MPHVNALTRRDILTALLGAPLALAGCQSEVAPLPPGEIVGASDTFGHLLRDGLSLRVPDDAWKPVGVVIVGGGVAGLSAAWRLARSGFDDFVLLELEDAPGGTSRSGTSPICSYPWGAHYLPAPLADNVDLIRLLDEMQVLEGREADGTPIVAEQFLCRDPQERVFYKGRWYEGLYLSVGAAAEDLAQLDAFQKEIDGWVAWRDAQGRRAFALPVETSSDDAEVTVLDKQTMADWLRAKGFTSPRLHWLVDYSCRDDYGLRSEQTSAWAGLFYFVSRMKSPGVEAQSLITWPEGNGRLVAHLHAACRKQVTLGLAAANLRPTETGVDVTAVRRDRTVAGFRAKHVIFAAPQFLAKYLIEPWRAAPPAHLADFEYGAWLVANLTLSDRPQSLGFPMAWDNVLYDSPSLGYVSATHQRLLDHGPTLWTYYYPLCDENPRAARERLLSLDRDAWADVALTDLAIAHPGLRPLVERLDVMRWGHAMIRPRPGFLWGPSRREAAWPFGNIHFANTDLSGVALFEEAFAHGLRAADEVLS